MAQEEVISNGKLGSPSGFFPTSDLAFPQIGYYPPVSVITSANPILYRFLDTSKQAIGMLFIHFANVYLADLTEEDPCSL